MPPKRGREEGGEAKPAQQDEELKPPKKQMFRMRAHSNPLNTAHFPVPISPDHVDWASHYPELHAAAAAAGVPPPQVDFADVGCGFGGLTIGLSEAYPDKLIMAMEIRDKVTEYVRQRILVLRKQQPGHYQNCSVVHTNAMKYLPHYFKKAQLSKMFFLFADPHFKASNHRRRIIQRTLLAEYAYVLKPGGMLYTITDVEDLGDWQRDKLEAHPLFERVSDEELESDPAAQLLLEGTEEGQKVKRNGGKTWRHVYRRIASPRQLAAAAAEAAVPVQEQHGAAKEEQPAVAEAERLGGEKLEQQAAAKEEQQAAAKQEQQFAAKEEQPAAMEAEQPFASEEEAAVAIEEQAGPSGAAAGGDGE